MIRLHSPLRIRRRRSWGSGSCRKRRSWRSICRGNIPLHLLDRPNIIRCRLIHVISNLSELDIIILNIQRRFVKDLIKFTKGLHFSTKNKARNHFLISSHLTIYYIFNFSIVFLSYEDVIFANSAFLFSLLPSFFLLNYC